MKRLNDIHNEQCIISENIGSYIILGGHGIMDGLKCVCKHDAYKIIGFKDNLDLMIKRYKKRINHLLPRHRQHQEAIILTKKEYNALPGKYGQFVRI